MANVTQFQKGQKVWISRGDQRILGEILNPSTQNQLEVIWFNGPGKSETAKVPLDQISSAVLVSQQRIYIEPGDYWQHGRVICERDRPAKSLLRVYTVALPGGEKVELFEDQFHVHSDLIHPDPFDALQATATETPFLCEHRSQFVRALVKQRAICAGMTGLISARIDLLPHQIDVVYRVLQDPRQRYLLADEDGLGKTIEAGIIMLQLRQDDPEATMIVLAPEHLILQWKEELKYRFELENDEKSRLQILSHDEVGKIIEPPELLIIDEAHHLVRGDAKIRQKAEKLAIQAPRLMLISATPFLGAEKELLTMLSWLEPNIYTAKQESEFRKRIERRQVIGKELLALRPGIAIDELKTQILNLQKYFDEEGDQLVDAQIKQKCQEILALIPGDSSGTAEVEVEKKILELRLQIRECFSLYPRLIRHRRRILNASLLRRDIARHEGELDPDYLQTIWAAFDQWRQHVSTYCRENWAEESDPNWRPWEAIFCELFAAIAYPPFALRLVQNRLKAKKLGKDSENADRVVTALPLCDGEAEKLKNLSAVLRKCDAKNDRIQLLVMLFRADARRFSRLPKTVVFTQFQEVALAIAERIRNELSIKVALLSGKNTLGTHTEQLQHFQNEPNCSILVCDAQGAEGLHLQFAERMVHFDLPLDPFALEQRISRLDRIGRVSLRVPSIIITTQTTSPSWDDNWFTILERGFRLFQESIADLRPYVDRRLSEMIHASFCHGQSAWSDLLEVMQKEIATQRELIGAQDAVDGVDLPAEGAKQLWQQLENYEEDLTGFKEAIFSYLKQVNRIDPFRMHKALPHQQVRWHALDNVLMREDWFKQIGNYLIKPMVFDRADAQRRRDALFLRIGHPFINQLNRFALRDDRGKAFIMWRWQKGFDVPKLFFRIDYMVEADSQLVGESVKEIELVKNRQRELTRLADSFFPPRVETLLLNEALEGIIEPQLAGWLLRSYDKRSGDRNIARGRIPILWAVVGRERWSRVLNALREQILALILESPIQQKWIQQGVQQVQQYFTRRTAQIESGIYSSDKIRRQILDTEKKLQNVMQSAIQKPMIRIDTAGAILLCGQACPELNSDDKD